MENFICSDNLFLSNEIFEKYFCNFYYLNLLGQVNKQFLQICKNIKKNCPFLLFSFALYPTEPGYSFPKDHFYSFVNDFISRNDFDKLNIYFTFSDSDSISYFSEYGSPNIKKYLHEQNPKTKKIRTKNDQEIKLC